MLNQKVYQTNYPGRYGHFQTVFPTLFRRITGVDWRRKQLKTPDSDFIDLDWMVNDYSRLVLLCHGLEGSSDTHYMRGMARACAGSGWDVLAYNFRGCSGKPNLLAKSYHSGSTDDLALVIKHALAPGNYQQLALVGFSLGGNQVLKYLGEPRDDRPKQLRGGVSISPPCDLSGCSDRLEHRENRIYQIRFLRSLLSKVKSKEALIEPKLGPIAGLHCRTIREFDERIVAPLNGFASAKDYYERASSRQFLPAIDYPTLLMSSYDDPFLPKSCYPSAKEINNPAVRFEYTRYGGHVSFMQSHPKKWYWGEQQTVEFLTDISAR